MRGRWLALALALLLLPTAGADWLQPGYDAAQTGNTPEAGPAWDDVVFQLTVPVEATQPVAPLILGHQAILGYRGPNGNVLATVSLENGSVDPVAEPGFGGYIQGLASDGRLVFVLTDPGYIEAFNASTWKREWVSHLDVVPLRNDALGAAQHLDGVANCLNGILATDGQQVYAACDAHQGLLFVTALDAKTGTAAWNFTRDGSGTMPNRQSQGLVTDNYTRTLEESNPPAGAQVFPTGITVLGDSIVVSSLFIEAQASDGTTLGAVAYPEYDGLAAHAPPAGTLRWVARNGAGGDAQLRASGNTGSANTPPAATGDGSRAFLELTQVDEWRADNTGPYPDRTTPIRATGSALESDPGSGFALAPEGLYATSRTGLFLLDGSMAIVRTTNAPEGQEWAPGGLVRTANGLLYGGTGASGAGFGGTHANVAALRAGSLDPLWLHRFPSDARFAISGGLLVAWTDQGFLTVLGHNAASPQPAAKVSTTIPAPGDLVTVDLSGTGPGLFGNVTQYRVDWGDGAATEWQDSPKLEHRFSTLTNVESRFFVRNAANQTASMTQLFVVGGRPELTFLQQQFAPERQNVTFFVLGLLATALAALWGVVQIRRSHGRLRRELNALEERLGALQGRPESLDDALRDFRVHAQDLLQRRKLDQSQYLVLRERIEELQRQVRMSVVDERMAFLPHGMVKRLEAMLADAQITGWERHHFLEALDAERLLTPAQRSQARGLVDGWFRADRSDP